MVWNNPLIKAPDGLSRFWFSTEAPDYFPLVSSLLWVQWRLWGMNPMEYHAVQILLHAGAAVLLWRVLRRLPMPGAWWAGMVFAVHPVNVETVAWITETKNTLPMVFYMTSLLFYLRFDDSGDRRAYGVSLMAFLLALLGKTSVVMLPFVLLGFVWWRRGRITRADIVRTIPFFAVALVLGLVTVWFQSNRAIIHTVIRDDAFASRLSIAARAVWFYLSKALIPVNLSFVYPRWTVNPASVLAWVPLVALAGAFAAAWWRRHSWGKPVLAALGYFCLSLLPVLGFVNIYFMRYSYVADHWQYVAIVGVIAAAVGTIAHLTRHLPRQPVMAAGGVAVLILAGLSFSGQKIYASNETLFSDVLKKNPDAWIAHNNLGLVLAQRGELDRARHHYTETLRLKPDLADAHLNLGNVYAVQKQDEDAILSYREALRLEENFRTRDALGEAHLRRGRRAEALEQFQKAISLKPDFARAHLNVGEVRAAEENWDAALAAYKQAVRLAPGNPDYSSKLARAFVSAGRPDEAVQELRRVLSVRPDYAPGYRNLATLLVRQDRRQEAAAALRDALRFDPGNPQIRADLEKLEADR